MIDLVAEQAPLGGLERWLSDPAINEVMVNAGSEVWVERAGRLEHVGRIRQLRHPGRVDERRRLDHRQPSRDEPTNQLSFDGGRDDRFLVLQTVAGADLIDRHARGQAGVALHLWSPHRCLQFPVSLPGWILAGPAAGERSRVSG